jgi:hypothetical protein
MDNKKIVLMFYSSGYGCGNYNMIIKKNKLTISITYHRYLSIAARFGGRLSVVNRDSLARRSRPWASVDSFLPGIGIGLWGRTNSRRFCAACPSPSKRSTSFRQRITCFPFTTEERILRSFFLKLYDESNNKEFLHLRMFSYIIIVRHSRKYRP